MTGDIEHSLRIRFNNLITEFNVDPYTVVKTYQDDQQAFYSQKNKKYSAQNDFCRSAYTQGMLDKYSAAQPIWLFWETCTLNSLIHCYSSFLEHNRIRDKIFPLFFGMRLLRNAASHHNCLLVPPSTNASKSNTLNGLLSQFISDIPEPDQKLVKTHVLSDLLLHDFTCVLFTYINFVRSEKIRDERLQGMCLLVERLDKHADWYEDESIRYKPIFKVRVRVLRILLERMIRFYEEADWSQRSKVVRVLTALPIREKGKRR